MIKVLLVDDHPMVIRGLRFFLSTQEDIVVAGEAYDGQEAIEKTAELLPDVILMDLDLPVINGIEATKKITEKHPEIKVIILTSYSDQGHVVPAIRAGAAGYQLKDIEPEQLAETIRGAFKGTAQIHPQVANQLMTHVAGGNTTDSSLVEKLTRREEEVLSLIAAGRSNKEISSELFITEKTVKTHVSNILAKLQVNDRTQAAIYAMKHGYDKV
ncbi:response regulator [Evansella clarkii]|jgi:DNA-binding NarL/FixJ family response regulator|uniref:response regulator n=1 Tax=Evansella clarkii TaxID=79879 RepID=UPI000996120A|nr:response regulator transcription factor [Evansella clarkii]